MANEFADKYFQEEYKGRKPSYQELERDYWRLLETSEKEMIVDYGNDLDTMTYGSGFPKRDGDLDKNGNFSVDELGSRREVNFEDPEYYKNCGWNLNNIAIWSGSILRHFRVPILGVNVPWLYMGMLFSTFCWHNEDNYLYSVNYHHFGAPKQW